MALNYLTSKNSNEYTKGASNLWMSLLLFFGFLFLSFSTISQTVTSAVSINRFVTEVEFINEYSILLTTNIMLISTQSDVNDVLSFRIPKGEELRVRKSKLRVTDSKGNVIWKGSVNKKIENGSIALSGIKGIKPAVSFPLTVEWETSILIYAVNEEFTWPSINEKEMPIRYLGFRVFADDNILKTIQTNIPESSPLMDQSTGLRGLVWELYSYEKNKAMQNAQPIENPFVKINIEN
ncbi:MAG: nitrogen fixation protein NifB [Tenuifilum sp.]|uniref:hypothetical protein n=1 Tax=Tenuifilum sp. TaxID=2760880 RepID=UPI0024AAC9A5|nr:hypothetical protein [Tenuifilum sp.]MDI3527149.1 nitrogen fixation protein NifB [Tenuifilum sp.]